VVAVLAVGYLNGVIRANFLGVATTFMYDAAMLGLYAGAVVGRWNDLARLTRTHTGMFVGLLVLWPTVLAVVPVHHPLVQLVSLRSAVWFLPVLLVGGLFDRSDWDRLARGTAVLNIVALVGGVYTYLYGIEDLYPQNAVTELMYRSRDVAGGNYRVPSFFLNAHQYGGTMMCTLPLLLDLLLRPAAAPRDRTLAAVGTAAAVLGVLMCGARSPVILALATGLVFWVLTGFSMRVGVAIGLAVAVGGYLVGTNERLQRIATLADTESLERRVVGSANEQFFDLALDYPLGAGLGAGAPSIPFFLAEHAPPPIGLENEYSRILVDTGWIGLGLWLGFVGWLLAVPPRFDIRRPWAIGLALAYAQVLGAWVTAVLGTGLLVSVPGSLFVLLQMGMLCRGREPAVGRPTA
jgi:O-Antigen ligase